MIHEQIIIIFFFFVISAFSSFFIFLISIRIAKEESEDSPPFDLKEDISALFNNKLFFISGLWAIFILLVYFYLALGLSAQAFSKSIFFIVLIALSFIDYYTRYLPNFLTIPLVWMGLFVQLFASTRTVGAELAIVGAIAGYLPLWIFAYIYRFLRGRDGMGFGDFKLLAAIGAWLGPYPIPWIILLASLLGSVFQLSKLLVQRQSTLHQYFPFGPWIVLATVIIYLFKHVRI